jgi:E3 ubiquitin-protein ligase HUWE1
MYALHANTVTDITISHCYYTHYCYCYKQQKALFLQFVTGTSKVPLEGFAQLQGMRGVQKFNIHRHYGGAHLLPSAHTCFNQLDLPEYTSEEQTRTRLMLALKEGSSGFGFA